MPKPTVPFTRAIEPRGDESADGTPQLFAGRYQAESRLGIGGMAEVLLARDTALDRRVALKLLAPQLAVDPVFVERFRREATAIASLNHPNVIVIYDHGVADGQPFIAMEYVPGRTLKELITVGAPLSSEAAVHYVSQALDGLAAAHSVGIVHRDVKPQNLIVRDDGTLKVADFGVARSAGETVLTEHGSVIGTPDYISPEQARGASAGSGSDLYSMGVVLFEMLTGSLPFSGEVPLAIANQHVGTPAPPVRQLNPAVPASLARVVARALSKEPSLRYRSAAEMKAALSDPLAEDPARTLIAPTSHTPSPAPSRGTSPPPTEVMSPPTRLAPAHGRRLTRRHGLAALGAVVALAGAAFVLAAGFGDDAPPLVGLPKVVGMSVASARSALVEGGFDVRVGAKRHSDQPTGTVAGVRPAGGSAARGALVTLIPSSGPSHVVVPAVTGFSLAAAIAELERLGFVVRATTAYAPAPAGTAVGTAPAAGTPVAPHSSISLTISAGPKPVLPAEPAPPGKSQNKHKDKHPGKKLGKAKGKP